MLRMNISFRVFLNKIFNISYYFKNELNYQWDNNSLSVKKIYTIMLLPTLRVLDLFQKLYNTQFLSISVVLFLSISIYLFLTATVNYRTGFNHSLIKAVKVNFVIYHTYVYQNVKSKSSLQNFLTDGETHICFKYF